MSDQPTDEHDAFREQRKSSLYWLRISQEELATLALLESLLPSFVRRRYRITHLFRQDESRRGSLSLVPAESVTDDLAAANALHADVDKLFGFLLGKRQDSSEAPERPTRSVSGGGLIRYEFALTGLFGFEGSLEITVGGLPAGSACHIIKKVTGTRVVEDVEYEMVCDDDEMPDAALAQESSRE